MRIENSVTRVTVLHHEARQVMPKSYPEWRNFNSHQTTIIDSFSCIFFLRRLYEIVFNLNMRYFINFTLKYVHFRSRNVQFGSYVRRPDVMHEADYNRTGENRGKPCRVCNKSHSACECPGIIVTENKRHFLNFKAPILQVADVIKYFLTICLFIDLTDPSEQNSYVGL